MPEKTAEKNTGLIIGIIAGVAAAIVTAVVVIMIVVLGKGGFEAGSYKLTSMTEGDTTMNADQLKEIGISGTFELKEDGTGVAHLSDKGDEDFKWNKSKKTITIDGKEIEVKVDGKSFTIEVDDGVTQTYTRD